MDEIVVGIDGSEVAQQALDFAADEARVHRAKLRVVHVWFEPVVSGHFTAAVMYDSEIIERAAQDTLDAAVARVTRMAPEIEVEGVLAHGLAAPVLLEQAADADLLVVGSRGHGGFAGLLLGSVSQYLAQHSPVPMVVVHPGRE